MGLALGSVATAVSARTAAQEAILSDLATARVVYLGETHGEAADHAAQLAIIQALHTAERPWALGLEMFQRPFQSMLDLFREGRLTLTELRAATDYDMRWGHPWQNYEPILGFAQTEALPLLALNAPLELTRQVSQMGLANIISPGLQGVPADMNLDDPAYRDLMRQVYDNFHQGLGGSEQFERFFEVQVLWDETMAEMIANYLALSPDHRVIVLVGQGHIVYGYGIPARLARRLPDVVQRTVLLNPAPGLEEAADHVWR